MQLNYVKIGGSYPRAFSPGLSSIGAAGFLARNSAEANEGLNHFGSLGNNDLEEEK